MTNFIATLQYYFSYPFVQYALIVGVLIALCSSLLGVTLVLKRFSFIGDVFHMLPLGAMAVATVLQFTSQNFIYHDCYSYCSYFSFKDGAKY